MGGQANCSLPIISPAGVRTVQVGNPTIQVNCTIPQSNCFDADGLPNVAASLKNGNGSETFIPIYVFSEEDRCIFVFEPDMTESFTILHCELPHSNNRGCNSEDLHLLISPEISEELTTELHTYTCTLSCRYELPNWYTKNRHLVNVSRFTYPEFWSSSISDCIDGFQTHKLSLNVTGRDLIDVLPALCGSLDPWKRFLHFSSELRTNITWNLTETTSSTYNTSKFLYYSLPESFTLL